MRNAARRQPQIDDDPIIHTFPRRSTACLPYQQGRVLDTVVSARLVGGPAGLKGSIPLNA